MLRILVPSAALRRPLRPTLATIINQIGENQWHIDTILTCSFLAL